MAHYRMMKTLIFNCYYWSFRIPFKNRVSELVQEGDCSSHSNCFQSRIDDGRGMISDRAANSSPEELRTTTPIPVASNSSKIAPSKFVFKVLGFGGFQIFCFGGCLTTGLLWDCWNSWRYCWARSDNFSSGVTAFLNSAFVPLIP